MLLGVTKVELDSDMIPESEILTPEIIEENGIPEVINLGPVALNTEDKFYWVNDGCISYKSLDDGDGYIHILTKE